jgi:putative DNA primase/helicase
VSATAAGQGGQNGLPPHVQVSLGANLTDSGNAEVLAHLHGDWLRYCASLSRDQRWLVWNNHAWEIDQTGAAYRAALNTARTRFSAATHIANLAERKRHAEWAITSENVSKIKATLEAASNNAAMVVTADQLDAHPLLAATRDGDTLDLATGQSVAPDPKHYITMTIGSQFDSAATCPRWLNFLGQVFDGDQELIAYVQRAVGYSLTGDTREQVLFLCYGDGANGKSVLLNILRTLLGDYAGNSPFDTFDAEARRGVGEDLAFLRGKRLVTIIETAEDRRLDEARVKAATGRDPITCRFLYGNPFSYQPQFKIWLAMNHKPIIRGTDRGIWRRLRLLPFTRNFEAVCDPDLENKLRQELPGILNWALEGTRQWLTSGLGTCKAIQVATEEYRHESDLIGQWISEAIEAIPGQVVVLDVLYRCYTEWCKRRGERFPLTSNSLTRELKKRGYEQDPKPRKIARVVGNPQSCRVWLNMKLTEEAEDWLASS